MKNDRKFLLNPRLRDARVERGWSQQELAHLVGTMPVNISRWENGSHFPTPYFRKRLSELFGKTPAELGLELPGAEISHQSIYQERDRLEEQLPNVPFMTREERTIFMKEVQALIVDARQAEQDTKSKQTKSELQRLIKTFEGLLIDIKNMPTRELSIISQVAKTSPALTGFSLEESFTELIRNFPSYRPGILSSSKVAPNSPVTKPTKPELRAIYEELDAKGKKK